METDLFVDFPSPKDYIMNVHEVLLAGSPPGVAYAERTIGSLRRESLDDVIVVIEGALRRTLFSYFSCYHGATHLGLFKHTAEPRPVQGQERGE